jgi:hypothetical protein
MSIQDRITERKWKSNYVDLSNCPFCGAVPDLYANDQSVLITCNNCGVTTGGRASTTIAIGIWNRRVKYPNGD